MLTWLWWTLGVALWFGSACLVGLLIAAIMRLRDLPETLGLIPHPLRSSAPGLSPAPARRHGPALSAPAQRRPAN